MGLGGTSTAGGGGVQLGGLGTGIGLGLGQSGGLGTGTGLSLGGLGTSQGTIIGWRKIRNNLKLMVNCLLATTGLGATKSGTGLGLGLGTGLGTGLQLGQQQQSTGLGLGGLSQARCKYLGNSLSVNNNTLSTYDTPVHALTHVHVCKHV